MLAPRPRNNVPTAGTDNTVTTLEDTAYNFTAADFGFTDPNDSPANNLQSVIITTIPAGGTLTLAAGASAPGAVVAGQVINAADLAFLTYSPPLNVNGAGADSFTFQVVDDDGTVNGGQDTDQTPNTMTIDITSVNDAPVGADVTVTTLEDTAYIFSISDFGFADPDDAPANNFINVVITTLPSNGALTLLAGSSAPGPVIAGQVVSVADIPFLSFLPAPDDNGTAYDSFTFQVQDDDGTLNGGADTDPVPKTITIDVIAVDDPPVLDVNAGMATFEGPMLSIKAVNSLSHYTEWTIGHVHAGALGWNGMITFAAVYYLVPRLWDKQRLYSLRMVNWHFWLATIGIVLYAAAMWVAGIMPGLMWREYGDDGYLVYAFSEVVSAMFPMYLIRASGGLLYLAGAAVMVYNVWMTIAGNVRDEKSMTETPHDTSADKPLVAVPAE